VIGSDSTEFTGVDVTFFIDSSGEISLIPSYDASSD
jgi:hypothetical protein